MILHNAACELSCVTIYCVGMHWRVGLPSKDGEARLVRNSNLRWSIIGWRFIWLEYLVVLNGSMAWFLRLASQFLRYLHLVTEDFLCHNVQAKIVRVVRIIVARKHIQIRFDTKSSWWPLSFV